MRLCLLDNKNLKHTKCAKTAFNFKTRLNLATTSFKPAWSLEIFKITKRVPFALNLKNLAKHASF